MGLRSQISFLVSHLILKDPFLRAIKTSAVCKAGALKGHSNRVIKWSVLVNTELRFLSPGV